MGEILASADIGSNTAHLLVAQTDGRTIERLVNESEWLSLGEVVSREKLIPKELEDRLLQTLRQFATLVRKSKATRFYIFATEAMRMAQNHSEVIDRIRRELRLKVDLIAPAREAELSLIGAQLDCPGTYPMLLVEVGGGSGQVALTWGNRVDQERSLPVGTGRLIAESGLQCPTRPEQLKKLDELIDEALHILSDFGSAERIVASGGVARGFVRALHPDGDRQIHRQELEYLRWQAQRLGEQQTAVRFGVKMKRAETFVPGASVYLKILERFQIQSMTVSEFGVREGAILSMFWDRI
ncbi:MAG: hypothetical protein JST40_03225 [Armatimonadetes bacterium]|nr:hypothetical protein [Armatimonadota bacterium]